MRQGEVKRLVSDIMCIRSIDAESCIHVVLCVKTYPLKGLLFPRVILVLVIPQYCLTNSRMAARGIM
jgi:hypothetical protein